MKRLEGKNMIREGALTFGMLTFNGKKFIINRPLPALGLATISAIFLIKSRAIKKSTYLANQLHLLGKVVKIIHDSATIKSVATK
jgi:hypothetical protein